MSAAFRTIGMVAGVVALAATGVGAFASAATVAKIGATLGVSVGTVAKVAAAVAIGANLGAQVTAKKPPRQGSATDITIGATMPSPYIMGRAYYGGSRVAQVGYGTEDDVKNAHAWVVDVHSVGGPVHALMNVYVDFVAVSFSSGNAVGYFHDNLYRDYRLGTTPESFALAPHWSGTPDWGSTYRLSGKAAMGYSARFPKKGDVFASGFPQVGAEWEGVLNYDMRADSTYPGGSGAQRWADPGDTAAFSAAKATWGYNRNPGLHALRYALGVWERDETDDDAVYQKVFGVGGGIDQVVVEDFAELANVCDANGWYVDGAIFEGLGINKWDNLKRILAAGGAEPVFKGARLGVKINAPRVALDTITMDDIAPGEPIVPGCQAYEARKNTLRPYFTSSAHRWQPVQAGTVQVAEFLAADSGEEKAEDVTIDLVTGGQDAADQVMQLAAYDLYNRWEQGPITLPLHPRLRGYPAGALLEADAGVQAYFGLQRPELVVTNKTSDLMAHGWTFSLMTDNPNKHTAALALTGTVPDAPSLVAEGGYDGAAVGPQPVVTDLTAEGEAGAVTLTWRQPEQPGWSHVDLVRSATANIEDAILAEDMIVGALGEVMSYEDSVAAGDWYYWTLVYDSSFAQLSVTGPVMATAA